MMGAGGTLLPAVGGAGLVGPAGFLCNRLRFLSEVGHEWQWLGVRVGKGPEESSGKFE